MEKATKFNKEDVKLDLDYIIEFYGENILFEEGEVLKKLFLDAFGYKIPLVLLQTLYTEGSI